MRRILPALVLILMAPLIAEVLPGSAPLSQPSILPFIILIYGPGALLIRELAVRTGRGWPCILMLGAAYGLIEEGLALQSLFNPNLYKASEWGCRILGVNGVYAEASIIIHAVWSAAIPILVCDLLFPRQRSKPYLHRFGLIATCVWYLLGVIMLALITRFSIAPGYWASRFSLECVASLVLILAVVALFVSLRAKTNRTVRDQVPAPPSIFLVILVSTFSWHFLLAALWRFQPRFVYLPMALIPMLVAMAVLASTLWLIHRWSKAPIWNERHSLAVAVGAIFAHSVFGGAIFSHTNADRATLALLGTSSLTALVVFVHRRTNTLLITTVEPTKDMAETPVR